MKHKNILTALAVLLLAGFTGLKGYSQEEVEMIYPYFDLVYLKDSDGHRTLGAHIYFEKESGGIGNLPGLAVKFYTNSAEPTLIGEAESDKLGWARIVIDDEAVLPVDDGGNWWFSAEYEGSERVSMLSAETTVMDVSLEMTLNDDESGNRSVTISAYMMSDGERIPMSGEEVSLFVPRMFSNLTVGTGTLEDGEVTIEVPGDIPGDAEGNLTLVGGFINHWQYANVEKRVVSTWGVPASHEVAESHRELWTQIAPTWMIITLTIMLLGVWGHYLFAVISIVRIGREGKKMKVRK